ncbi:hypothetical protein KIN20_008172 [Parelaphostrongylus tenuis]|uniref:Uncharacterized protein n=1 Tax=Parelaphostrongylus tenuis TaxID=148309 RepID=A0AAD5QIL8_PARTN|nr:hypothetical protein KIN20_008172 [Parelaphostrongylus tenuis]
MDDSCTREKTMETIVELALPVKTVRPSMQAAKTARGDINDFYDWEETVKATGKEL